MTRPQSGQSARTSHTGGIRWCTDPGMYPAGVSGGVPGQVYQGRCTLGRVGREYTGQGYSPREGGILCYSSLAEGGILCYSHFRGLYHLCHGLNGGELVSRAVLGSPEGAGMTKNDHFVTTLSTRMTTSGPSFGPPLARMALLAPSPGPEE